MKEGQRGGTRINILLTIIVLLSIAGWINFRYGGSQKSESTQPTPTPSIKIPENWKTLTNLNHVFKYPEEATGEAREDESIVYFMGKKQIDSGRTQTELFDGYSFRVGEISSTSELPLKELANGERENAINNCSERENDQVSQLKNVFIDGQVGYQYSVQGCYIDYTETIASFDNKFYRISQSYVGDPEDQRKYQEITNQILSSFKFIN